MNKEIKKLYMIFAYVAFIGSLGAIFTAKVFFTEPRNSFSFLLIFTMVLFLFQFLVFESLKYATVKYDEFIETSTFVFLALSISEYISMNYLNNKLYFGNLILASIFFMSIIGRFFRMIYYRNSSNHNTSKNSNDYDGDYSFFIYMISSMIIYVISYHFYHCKFMNVGGYGSYYTLCFMFSLLHVIYFKRQYVLCYSIAILILFGSFSSKYIHYYDQKNMEPQIPEFIQYFGEKIPTSPYVTIDKNGDYTLIENKKTELNLILTACILNYLTINEQGKYTIRHDIYQRLSINNVNDIQLKLKENNIDGWNIIRFLEENDIRFLKVYPDKEKSFKNNEFIKIYTYVFSYIDYDEPKIKILDLNPEYNDLKSYFLLFCKFNNNHP